MWHRAGAGKTSIYKRWANTEGLLVAALAVSDTSFDAERERISTVTEFDMRGALVEVLTMFAAGLDTPVGRPLQVLQIWRQQHPRLLEQVRQVTVTPHAAVLHAALDRAVAEGAVPAENVTS